MQDKGSNTDKRNPHEFEKGKPFGISWMKTNDEVHKSVATNAFSTITAFKWDGHRASSHDAQRGITDQREPLEAFSVRATWS
eukprot:6320806-Amphidinium_carterae.1